MVSQVKFWVFWISEYFQVFIKIFGYFVFLFFSCFQVFWIFLPKYLILLGPITYPNYMYITGTWIMDSNLLGCKRNRSKLKMTFSKHLVGSKCVGPKEIKSERNQSTLDTKTWMPKPMLPLYLCAFYNSYICWVNEI